MTSPLRKTKDPKQNAPAWAAGIATALTVVLAVVSDLDLPGWAVAVIAILVVGGGVASQFFTMPDEEPIPQPDPQDHADLSIPPADV